MNSVERALESLCQGRAIILLDAKDREAEGDLAFAARFSTPQLVNTCLGMARGLLCVSLWPEDAQRLGITRLVSNGHDPFGTPFGLPIDLRDGSSGISAASRSATLKAASDPSLTPGDFVIPGHVHTLIGHPQGLRGRLGHTEAILDLVRSAGVHGPGVLCEILNPEGEIASERELEELSRRLDIPLVHIDDVIEHCTGGRVR
jgi:3,4-dihydroxy-2-butanone 4-phosphate synthase